MGGCGQSFGGSEWPRDSAGASDWGLYPGVCARLWSSVNFAFLFPGPFPFFGFRSRLVSRLGITM